MAIRNERNHTHQEERPGEPAGQLARSPFLCLCGVCRTLPVLAMDFAARCLLPGGQRSGPLTACRSAWCDSNTAVRAACYQLASRRWSARSGSLRQAPRELERNIRRARPLALAERRACDRARALASARSLHHLRSAVSLPRRRREQNRQRPPAHVTRPRTRARMTARPSPGTPSAT